MSSLPVLWASCSRKSVASVHDDILYVFVMYSRFTRSSTTGIWHAASFTFSTRTWPQYENEKVQSNYFTLSFIWTSTFLKVSRIFRTRKTILQVQRSLSEIWFVIILKGKTLNNFKGTRWRNTMLLCTKNYQLIENGLEKYLTPRSKTLRSFEKQTPDAETNTFA